MVTIDNEWIVITEDDVSYFPLIVELSFHEDDSVIYRNGKKVVIHGKDNYLFSKKNNSIYIPIGLYNIIKKYLVNSNINDRRSLDKLCNSFDILNNINEYRRILNGIELYDEQLLALKKIFIHKRCILQCNTGFGKSEVACAFISILSDNIGRCPTTIMIEPTVNLSDEIFRRFKKYNIPVNLYSDNRTILDNCVNICCPKSINNDMVKDKDLFKNVEVLIGDECHHYKSETYRNPVSHMPNLEYSIGLSASVISKEHIGNESLRSYSFEEALAMSATGPLVLNITAENMINKGNLANPVLIMLENPADEYIPENMIKDWHQISEVRLESDNRVSLIADSAKFFCEKNRKVLILVSTVRCARKILKFLYDRGLSDIVRASYGGNVYEYYDGNSYIEDNTDVKNDFNTNKYMIMIGTSHIYEGADFKCLDVLIMASAGKSERIQIQCAGRVLRKSKNGKYAYIVDFTDDNDSVLSRHSSDRVKRYCDIIGVPKDKMFHRVSISDLGTIFDSNEM